jgi:large subunit ribosomal protein L25
MFAFAEELFVMAEVTLTATTGRTTGSPDSRRLRAEGKIPAVVYGMGKDAVSVTILRSDLRKAMTTEAGVNALIKLEVDGAATEYTLVKEIQRHTVRREVTHLDFLRIDPEKAMVLDVPIVLTGDAKKVTGGGGFVDQKLSTLQVTVRPDSIPTQLTAVISNMDVEDVLTVADLTLPSGVTTELDPSTPIVTAALTRAAIVAARAAAKSEESAAAPAE